MNLTISQNMIPLRNANRPKSLLSPGPLYITVHETGNTNPGANEFGEAIFSIKNQGGPSNVAYHLTVGPTKAIQLLPLNVIGWHAGDGCDNRVADVGCFASIAIEVTVGDNNRDKVKTRENLVQLLQAICEGDPRLDFGETDPKRFSPERIAPHKRWSSYSKQCPRYMLDDGYFWTLPALVNARLAGGAPAGPTKPKPEPIAELAPYRNGDPNAVPPFVTVADGTRFWFVGDRVRATRSTPRLQKAFASAARLNTDIEAGEEFEVDWIFVADDGLEYYVTPWWTRVAVADTQRIADRRAAA